MAKNIVELIGKIARFGGITADSRQVTAGMIFVAVKGRSTDGHDYITDAIENGATAVVGEREIKGLPVDYYIVEDSRLALGELASAFYGNPASKLKIIGVTGTKGKTTTCHIIYHILTKLGKKAGLSSSISVPGNHVTSPDVVSLHKSLKEFVDKGFEYAVIEVSSHGIDQKRIAGIKFDIGVLTNIAPEHLDYHKTLKEYKRVKMSFINSCKEKVISPKDTKLDILPGKYNNLNAETAVMTCERLGIPRSEALGALLSFELPEGRLSRIENNLGINLIVDFAHTPDSLLAVLSYLKTQTKGKLITVFGCAGERDTKKRFQMGKISVNQSDISVFTSEDPRSENVFRIINKIAEGARNAGGVEGKNFYKVPERGEAIALAISLAKKDDTVVVLGKGHEKSMAWGDREHPWSDDSAIRSFLRKDDDISAIILAAGKGTRMKSNHPKVLHKICGRPMIAYTLENLRSAGVGEIVTVVSFRKNEVIKEVGVAVKIAEQKNPKGGTADAAKAGFEKVNPGSQIVLVINGDDSAFYSPETIKRIIESHKARERVLTFVSLIKDDPTGLGRVIRGENGLITKIVEEKDATEEEKKIKEVNDGLYVFNKVWFSENIGKVRKSPQGEYYLVDLIKMAIDQRQRMATFTLSNDNEWQGINTQEELQKAIKKMEDKLK